MKAVEAEVMRVKEHKETRREYMTYAMEIKRRELAKFQEGREEGREEGRQEERLNMILAMLQDGVAKETIAKYAKVPVEYITELGQ